jgi:1-acyl-sn-glycerol-3-phosphate acyltransferase
MVAKRLHEHIQHGDRNPIIIFPEGTCVNNTSVLMFKKGTFELPNVDIYPVAIKCAFYTMQPCARRRSSRVCVCVCDG